jgi:hypothetical protein
MEKTWKLIWSIFLKRLCWANLTNAMLAAADMTEANLTAANLTGAYLTAANIVGADMTGAKWDATTIWPEGIGPIAADLPENDK